jgi:hypothetical protein
VILDWTAARLRKRIDDLRAQGFEDQAIEDEGMLELYELGEMEVAWVGGSPEYRWCCDVDPPPEGMLRDD